MPQQRDAFFQTVFPDQRLQPATFRAAARDETLEAQSAGAQLGAGPHQKCMILHPLQPPHCQQREFTPVSFAGRIKPLTQLDSEP
jgi:hypothetical protein